MSPIGPIRVSKISRRVALNCELRTVHRQPETANCKPETANR